MLRRAVYAPPANHSQCKGQVPKRQDEIDLVRALLRQVRDKAGYTQAELAAKLGKPQSYVAKTEGPADLPYGERPSQRPRKLGPAELHHWCRACGTTAAEFMTILGRDLDS